MSDFIPLPLFSSGHQQTIIGYLLRSWQREPDADRHLVTLPDGDKLHLYDTVPAQWQAGQPVALIVHGLSGSHQSGSVLRLTWELLRQQVRVVRINLRGCGSSMLDCKRPYHAGCSADIHVVIEQASVWCPNSPLWLIGISLGGNVVLKLAGEVEQKTLPSLCAVVAIAPPIDLQRCSALLEEPQNRRYEFRFVNELCQLAKKRAKLHGDAIPRFPDPLRLSQFDDQYTAPRCGFSSVGDYYAKASSLPLLCRIEVPTHIITAEDDPFVDAASFRQVQLSAAVRLHLTRHGGHLGYVSRPRHGGWCWLERFVVKQLTFPSK